MKVAMLAILVTVVLLFTNVSAAENIDYTVILEDNGNSIVFITIDGSGLYVFPIQEDVQVVDVDGGLYLIENGKLEISVGSTERAVVVYQTSLLTGKEGSIWEFTLDLIENSKNVNVLMPENTILIETSPQALIESGEIMKLYWSGEMESVSSKYEFQSRTNESIDLLPVFIIIIVILIITGYFIVKRKPKNSIGKKDSILETLSENEKKIVNTLLENKGRLKRSKLEKITGISKSSLAATLKNLERKKILEVDRTYASHYVKFTEWFNEL